MNVNKRQLCYIHLWVRYCLSDFYHQMVSASVHAGVCAHACFSDHSNVIRNTDHIHRTLLRLYIIMHQLSRHPRHKPSRELQRRATGMTTELPGPQLYVSVQALVTLYILVYKINSCCLYIRSFSLLCKLKLKQDSKFEYRQYHSYNRKLFMWQYEKKSYAFSLWWFFIDYVWSQESENI